MKISKQKYDELVEELAELKTTGYEKVMQEKEAAGGPMESFHQSGSAKEEFVRWSLRVAEIERVLSGAEVYENSISDTGRIAIGNIVRLGSDGEELSYTIVDPVEADPTQGKISKDSMIGKAVLGKYEGDVIEVKLPTGVVKYKIIKIS